MMSKLGQNHLHSEEMDGSPAAPLGTDPPRTGQEVCPLRLGWLDYHAIKLQELWYRSSPLLSIFTKCAFVSWFCLWSQSLCHYPCCHVKRLLHRMLSQLGKCFPSQFTPWRKNLTLPKLFPLWNPGEILSGSWNLCSQFSRVKDWSWGQIISMEKSWQWHASALAGPLHSTIYPNKHCAGCGVFLCSGCCSGASGPIELAPDRFLEQL